MKINYTCKKSSIKVGEIITEDELNSGKLYIFDEQTMEEFVDFDPTEGWVDDRIITKLADFNQDLGYISGSKGLYVNLISLQQLRDGN